MKKYWPTKKLGEVVELAYGKGISKTERHASGQYVVYGANGGLGRTDKFLVEGEAIIVGRKGSVGELHRVSGKFWPSDVTYFIVGNDQIDVDYLFYFLKSQKLQRFAVGVKPGLNRNRVYELGIPLPPLAEQKRIVAKLEKLLGKVKEAKRLRAEAQALTASLLPAELDKIFKEGKKKGWEERKIAEVARVINGRAYSQNELLEKGKYRVLRVGNFFTNKSWYFSDLELEPDKYCDNGDLLYAWSASFGPRIWEGERVIYHYHVWKIEPSRLISKFYLKYLLEEITEEMRAEGGRGATMSHLTKGNFENVLVPVPPLAEQRRIVAHLDTLSEKVRTLQALQAQTATDLAALEKSILSKAFSGEFV